MSCGSKAPDLTFCVLRVVSGDPVELFCSHPKEGDTVIPIEGADRFVCQPRRDAELLRNYVINLEKKAARCN